MGRLPVSETLNVVLLLALVLLAGAKNAGESEATAYELWAEEKIARVERAKHRPRGEIWSRRCERQGKDVLVKRADMEPWQIHCAPRRVLTVAQVSSSP